MRNDLFWAIVLAVFVAFVFVAGPLVNPREVPVIWDGDRPSCPVGYDLSADEAEARAGLDSAHCERSR